MNLLTPIVINIISPKPWRFIRGSSQYGKREQIYSELLLNSPVRNSTHFPLTRVSTYLKDGFTVADIGSGTGYYSFRLANLKKNIKVITVDPNHDARKYLEELIRKKGIDNIRVAMEPADSIGSIKDSSVDFVFSHLMLCCMSNHEGVMGETIRMLKNRGNAFISVNRSSSESDERNLTLREWESIKKKFNVVADGKSLTSRWIIIDKNTDEPNYGNDF